MMSIFFDMIEEIMIVCMASEGRDQDREGNALSVAVVGLLKVGTNDDNSIGARYL
jgi:hypothetical protein